MSAAHPIASILPDPVLVCFAVKQESWYFAKFARAHPQCLVLLTGIGRRNVEKVLPSALANLRPQLVISSGFAGGLAPQLAAGTVLFDAGDLSALSTVLRGAGARPARFHCTDRIAATAAAKRQLRQTTGADAVEMESAAIRNLCRAQGIPSATIRIISDAADEDLPLDFNRLMTPDQRLNYASLAWTLVRTPMSVFQLINFHRRITAFGRKLAATLQIAVETFWRGPV